MMTASFHPFAIALSVPSKSSIFSTHCVCSSTLSDCAASRAAPAMLLVAGSPRLARNANAEALAP